MDEFGLRVTPGLKDVRNGIFLFLFKVTIFYGKRIIMPYIKKLVAIISCHTVILAQAYIQRKMIVFPNHLLICWSISVLVL